ncbi:MAG: MBL fold metallo-hydrolase [Patescibacteria group bacterium]
MVITYYGEGSFRLQSGDFSILVDPSNNRLKGDLVIRTLAPVDALSTGAEEITFSGEYEVRGIEVLGWQVLNESSDKFVKTVYLVKWEDIHIALLGHISDTLSAEILENLGDPDVLILPIGGGHFLSSQMAVRLIKQIEPAVVLPSFFKDAKDFLKEIGQKTDAQEKFVFKKKDLDGDKSRVVVLKES